MDIKQQMLLEARRQRQAAPQGGGYGGYGIGRGPREVSQENKESEVEIPRLQANESINTLLRNCVGLTLAIILILFSSWFILYRYHYGNFILFPIFGIYVFFGRWAVIRSTRQEDGIDNVINASAAIVFVVTFFLVALHCIGEIKLPWELIPFAIAVWVVGCWRYCTVEVRGRLVQRYNISITDKHYPAMRNPIDREDPLDIYIDGYGQEPEQERPPSKPLPPAPARAEWVEKASNGTGKIHQLELPISPDKMKALAEHIIIKDQPFSETACCRTSGILSQPEYGNIRDWLIASERGFARWVNDDNHKSGVVVTAKGRALLRAFMPEVNPKIVGRRLPTPPAEEIDGS